MSNVSPLVHVYFPLIPLTIILLSHSIAVVRVKNKELHFVCALSLILYRLAEAVRYGFPPTHTHVVVMLPCNRNRTVQAGVISWNLG